MWLLDWLKELNPVWYGVAVLVIQAAHGGWFMRGLSEDRKKMGRELTEKIDKANASIAAMAGTLTSVVSDVADLQTAVAVQGAEVGYLRSEYTKCSDMILVTMPKVVEASIKRASDDAYRAARRRRD